MDNMMNKIVEEELEDAKKKILSRMRGFVKDGNQAWAPRNMKLLFKNWISQAILTGDEIRGQGKKPLEVVLVDESTGNIVDIEPESSATVEILLLKGEPNASEGDDWTVEQFNENIVRETEQRKHLLAGNQCIKLQNGMGLLLNIKFRHHATKMRPSVFKLGARVVDTFHGVCIKEAKTTSFVVKDFRKKYYIKHEAPSLSDEVFRLKNICKGGKIEKRLQDHNIRTVEHFLTQYQIDPQGLKNIVNLGQKKWKLTVENALACSSDKRMSCYTNKQKTTGNAFDLSGQILGPYIERLCTPTTNILSEKHKADAENLLESACENWEKVEPFKDENSVQRHLNDVGGRENTQTCEMNFPMISQTGIRDCSLFSTDDMEINPNAFLAPFYSSNFDPLFGDFDEVPDQY